MIAVDTSSFIAFLAGEDAVDVVLLTQAVQSETLVLPPVVVTELLSARHLSTEIRDVILALPQLPIKTGYWQRVGDARSTLINAGKKARLADTMIALSCLDHDVALITRDGDYRHFANHFSLRLLSN